MKNAREPQQPLLISPSASSWARSEIQMRSGGAASAGRDLACGDDGLEIGDESLANATGGQVKPSIFGKLLKSLGFEYEFQFFTVAYMELPRQRHWAAVPGNL